MLFEAVGVKSPRGESVECKEKEIWNRPQGAQTVDLGKEIFFWGCTCPSCTLVFLIDSPERELNPEKPLSTLERRVSHTH